MSVLVKVGILYKVLCPQMAFISPNALGTQRWRLSPHLKVEEAEVQNEGLIHSLACH